MDEDGGEDEGNCKDDGEGEDGYDNDYVSRSKSLK